MPAFHLTGGGTVRRGRGVHAYPPHRPLPFGASTDFPFSVLIHTEIVISVPRIPPNPWWDRWAHRVCQRASARPRFDGAPFGR